MLYKHKNGVSFRKIEEYDLELLKELKDESWFGTHQITIVNMLNQKEWFENVSRNHNCLFLIGYAKVPEIRVNEHLITQEITVETPIGVYKITNIDWVNRSYDSAHDIFLKQRGKKFGNKLLEAGVDFGMEVLNMRRIDTEVLVTNEISLKTAKFVGFIEEGIRRKAIEKCGKEIDSRFLGLLREDWMNLQRVKEYGGICHLK